MRLDHYLASTTELSRKDAKKAVASGRVMVSGEVCRRANQKIAPSDTVWLDGDALVLPGDLYLMMHKPAGVLSATTDSNQPTALDLLPANLASRVHIAGRLDKDTTGLLLLTSDGQWSHRVTSPRHDCPKTYRVGLADTLPSEACRALEQGVQLRGESAVTRPAQVLVRGEREIDLTISEGRYHQVKRMLAAVGNRVERLHRLRIGPIVLDDDLAPGAFRALTSEEIHSMSD